MDGSKLVTLFNKVKNTWGEFSCTNAGTHASSIAFFFFLSGFPLMIIYASIVSAISIDQQQVVAFFCSMTPDTLNDFVEGVVNEAYAKSGIALSVSILTLLWTGSRVIRVIRNGLNAVYGIEETRNAVQVRVISIGVVIILIAFLTAVTAFIFSGGIQFILAGLLPGAQGPSIDPSVLNSILLLIFGALVFACTYAFLPDGKQSFREQIPGAVLASIAWFALSFGFRIYIDNFSNYDLLYGSLATVAIFLFWLYLIFYILLAGGFINRYRMAEREAQRQGSTA